MTDYAKVALYIVLAIALCFTGGHTVLNASYPLWSYTALADFGVAFWLFYESYRELWPRG